MLGTLSREAKSHHSGVHERLAHIRASVARSRRDGRSCNLDYWGDHFNNGAGADELNYWGDHFNNGAGFDSLSN